MSLLAPVLSLGLTGALATALPSAVGPQGAPPVRRHVVIVGVNTSVDQGVAPLSYADDDAARYAELLGAEAASLVVLSVLDAETQRLFPDVAARARPPSGVELERGLGEVFAAVREQRAAGIDADLIFVFVGHGAVGEDGQGYVSLLDGRLTRSQLFEAVLERSPARFNHIVIDACSAYHLLNRGADAAQAVRRLLDDKSLARHPNTGVLLATSSAKETHEWARIRGGVFSHEVLSALTGAADVDGDGALEYAEVGAFIEAANAGVTDPRAHVELYLRPPPLFLARPILSAPAMSAVRFAARDEGRFVIEDARGLTVAELNKNGEQPLSVALVGAAPFRVSRAQDAWTVAPGAGVRAFAKLPRAADDGVASRSSVAAALEQGLFSVAFGKSWVAGYAARLTRETPVPEDDVMPPPPTSASEVRGVVAGTSGVAAGVLLVGGAVAGVVAGLGWAELDGGEGKITAFQAQEIAGRTNAAIAVAAVLGGAAVIAVAAAGVALILPSADAPYAP